MKRLFLITHNDHNPEAIDLLKTAAHLKNIQIVELIPGETEYRDFSELKLSSDDGVYRVGITDESRLMERDLLAADRKGQVNTLRSTVERVDGWEEVELFEKHGVPVIPSFRMSIDWYQFKTDYLETKIQQLNGFPVVLKRMGLSHGQGLQLVGNAQDLYKIIHETAQDEIEQCGVREYLSDYTHARIILVGGKVVDSIEYKKPENDFRTNATETPIVIPQKFDQSIYAMCEKAAKVRSTTFGGVDVLIDNKTGCAFIAEYNDPCNFARAELLTGIKISEKILDYLFT